MGRDLQTVRVWSHTQCNARALWFGLLFGLFYRAKRQMARANLPMPCSICGNWRAQLRSARVFALVFFFLGLTLGVGVGGLRLGVAGLLEIELSLIGNPVAIVVVAMTQIFGAQTGCLFHEVSPIEVAKPVDSPS
jgi:hypothetical protein